VLHNNNVLLHISIYSASLQTSFRSKHCMNVNSSESINDQSKQQNEITLLRIKRRCGDISHNQQFQTMQLLQYLDLQPQWYSNQQSWNSKKFWFNYESNSNWIFCTTESLCSIHNYLKWLLRIHPFQHIQHCIPQHQEVMRVRSSKHQTGDCGYNAFWSLIHTIIDVKRVDDVNRHIENT